MSVFSIKPDSVRPYGSVLINASSKVRQYSGDITAIMGELDGSLAEVKPSLEVLANQTMEESNALSKLGDALTQIVTAYTSAESNIMGNMNGSGTSEEYVDPEGCKDGESGVFDVDDGKYGGNQMNFKTHNDVHHFLWFEWGDDVELYKFIRQHPGYENMTDDEIKAMLAAFTTGGCGWVSDVNMIFAEFEGNPGRFEMMFGFPMYDNDGEFNYDMLAIDYYLCTRNHFYIGDGDMKGAEALSNSIRLYYRDHPDEFRAKYGIDIMDADGHTTDAAWEKINAETDARINEAKANGKDYLVYENDGVGAGHYERTNRMNCYLRERSIDTYTSVDYTGVSPDVIKQAIDNGQVPTIEAVDFYLYDENGVPTTDEPYGGHAMVITDVTPDGKYVVSSWGHKYILDPNDNKPNGYSIIQNITVTNIYND